MTIRTLPVRFSALPLIFICFTLSIIFQFGQLGRHRIKYSLISPRTPQVHKLSSTMSAEEPNQEISAEGQIREDIDSYEPKYLSTCAEFPPTRDPGYPRIIDVDRFSEDMNFSDLRAADGIATALYMYKPETLHRFFDISRRSATFHNRPIYARGDSSLCFYIRRKGNLVTVTYLTSICESREVLSPICRPEATKTTEASYSGTISGRWTGTSGYNTASLNLVNGSQLREWTACVIGRVIRKKWKSLGFRWLRHWCSTEHGKPSPAIKSPRPSRAHATTRQMGRI